ncbi:MAG: hypothetical protein HY883_04845, partial [Deltaproteobacteria bacterium]|nr:hypothetical protein [Deltaproteobacteria bacterium]
EKRKVEYLKPLLDEFSLRDDLALEISLAKGGGAGVKPVEVVSRLLGLSSSDASLIPILKVKTVLES